MLCSCPCHRFLDVLGITLVLFFCLIKTPFLKGLWDGVFYLWCQWYRQAFVQVYCILITRLCWNSASRTLLRLKSHFGALPVNVPSIGEVKCFGSATRHSCTTISWSSVNREFRYGGFVTLLSIFCEEIDKENAKNRGAGKIVESCYGISSVHVDFQVF